MLLSEWWRLNVETVMENSFSKPGTDSRYYSCVGHVVLGMVRLVSMTSSFVEAVMSSPHQQVASDRAGEHAAFPTLRYVSASPVSPTQSTKYE